LSPHTHGEGRGMRGGGGSQHQVLFPVEMCRLLSSQYGDDCLSRLGRLLKITKSPSRIRITFSVFTCQIARSGDAGESSDWEEGGMDLSVDLRPIGGYLCNRSEMLNHCMRAIGKQRLEHMLPDELKTCSTEEIRALCLKQLEGMSPTQVRHILAGVSLKTFEYARASGSWGDVGNNAFLVLLGYDSDVLSLVAKSDDNDQIGWNEREDLEEPDDAHSACNDAESKREREREGRDNLESDIDRCVKNILHLPQTSDALGLSGPTSQLEMLELELRARAIKALMKANEKALESHSND
uniref:Caspase activity and apoptosis inhibitor 1 n=1 Tax=Eptatretus burgeri TaxID=7764 RepID=A0A8C4N3H4_EPTBU